MAMATLLLLLASCQSSLQDHQCQRMNLYMQYDGRLSRSHTAQRASRIEAHRRTGGTSTALKAR